MRGEKGDIVSSVAIITGASQGIGRSTAIRLARDFPAIVLAARNADALREQRCVTLDRLLHGYRFLLMVCSGAVVALDSFVLPIVYSAPTRGCHNIIALL
jgi:NAD(P)-dependent dehydrogenase (short-subunit alcohol dehydrogenase family)